jgi:hypothetical protein
LTAAAFVYFLPAMMVSVISGADELDCFPDALVRMLSPPRGRMDEFHAERLSSVTASQAEAILAFLQLHAARERASWMQADWPSDAADAMPVDKVLVRAIEYWTTRCGKSDERR